MVEVSWVYTDIKLTKYYPLNVSDVLHANYSTIRLNFKSYLKFTWLLIPAFGYPPCHCLFLPSQGKLVTFWIAFLLGLFLSSAPGFFMENICNIAFTILAIRGHHRLAASQISLCGEIHHHHSPPKYFHLPKQKLCTH